MSDDSSTDSPSPETPASDETEERRDFLLKAGSVCAGCAVAAVPIAAGLRVVADPVTRDGGTGGGAEAPFIPVASLDSLPEDGSPQKFTVRADKSDAWSRFPNQVVGAVFLRRLASEEEAEPQIQAFNVVCPHLGCAIEFRDEPRDYFCPCHNSSFALDDGAQEKGSPSARGMDELATRIEGSGEISVQFQNFVMGIPEKKPV